MKMATDSPDVLLSLICELGYVWCASRFLRRQLHGSSLESTGFAGFFFFGRGILTWFLESSKVPYILYALGHHLLTFILVMAWFREKRGKKLLAAVLLETMTRLIWNFSESFWSCAGLILFHRVTGGRQITVGIWTDRVIVLLTCTAGVTAVVRLSELLVPVLEDKRESWYHFLTVPLVCITLLMDVADWAASNGILVQAWGRYGLYENQLFSHGAMCLFSGLAMVSSGFFVFGMERIDREESLREQYRSQVAYYQMLEEQYSRMERLRHDMKNHMIALNHLVQKQKWEQTADYVREMKKAGCVEEGEEATGSLVMDALLYHKRQQAEGRGICWECDARLPADTPVREIDLCIIAGNMLDNAVEACARLQEKSAEQPFIHIYMGNVKRCLLLEVQNSTDLPEGEEIDRSRKEDAKRHGLGLSNIRAAAARYHGTVHVGIEKGVFVASVLLPLCQETSAGRI